MASGTYSVERIGREIAGIDLGDERLDRRLVKTAMVLTNYPGVPINEACRSWAATQGDYRLFDNRKTSPEAIRAPHIRETVERVGKVSAPVLVVHDTVFYSYGQRPRTKTLEAIDKSNSAHERWLCVHNALAFTTSGVPLGMLSQNIWVRQAAPEEEHR